MNDIKTLRKDTRKLVLITLKPHVLGIVAVVFFECLIAIVTGVKVSFYNTAPFYMLEIPVFYFMALCAYPYLAKGKRVKWKFPIGLLVILCILSYLYALIWLAVVMISRTDIAPIINWAVYGRGLYRISLMMELSLAYWLAKRFVEKDREAQNLAIANLEYQNKVARLQVAYLQSQMNPHTILNLMNVISNAIEGLSDRATKTLDLTSEIIQYAFQKPGIDDKVDLFGEVKQILTAIRLHHLRFPDNSKLEYDIDVDSIKPHHRIIPLLLFTLVENLFKHGDLSKPAKLEIRVIDDQLSLVSENHNVLNGQISSTGIGIANTQFRLNQYYKDAHELRITKGDGIFKLYLSIIL